jgi:hypothetical protein
MSMFAALSALDNSGDKTSGRPVTVATTTSSTGTHVIHAFRYPSALREARSETHGSSPPPIAGASSKKKKKKSGGGGGNANDAMLAERMQRLMAPLPSREPAPEQWSKVEKGAGVAKSVARRGVGASLGSTSKSPTALDPSFAVLRKFSHSEENGDGGDDGADAADAVDLDAYKVSAPFMHVFEDTGSSAWCCVVTSASGFDSPPVPIAAAVPRVRKVKSASETIVLEKEEKREVVTEFRRRQREARKAEKANKPKKKKKKKKGAEGGDEPGDGDEGDELPSEATVSMDAPDSLKSHVDREALSGSIMSALFARAPRETSDDATPLVRPTQEITQAQVRAHQQQQALERQHMLAHQQRHEPSRSDSRAIGATGGTVPPPGLGGIAPSSIPPPAAAEDEEKSARFLRDWSGVDAAEEQRRLMEAQSAQMAEMQRQLAEALAGQEEAKRLAGQAQAAAVAAAAAAAAAQAQAQKEVGMRKDWRSGAGGGDGKGGRRSRVDGRGVGRGGPPPGFGGNANANAPPGFGGSAPPGFEAPAAPPTFGSNSYVPPAFRRAKE